MPAFKKIKGIAAAAKKYLSGRETYVAKGVKSNATIPKKKPFKPKGPTSTGIGVGY